MGMVRKGYAFQFRVVPLDPRSLPCSRTPELEVSGMGYILSDRELADLSETRMYQEEVPWSSFEAHMG